jgi:hypothetical protein
MNSSIEDSKKRKDKSRKIKIRKILKFVDKPKEIQ